MQYALIFVGIESVFNVLFLFMLNALLVIPTVYVVISMSCEFDLCNTTMMYEMLLLSSYWYFDLCNVILICAILF